MPIEVAAAAYTTVAEVKLALEGFTMYVNWFTTKEFKGYLSLQGVSSATVAVV